MSSISQPPVQVTVQPTDIDATNINVPDGAPGWINADFSAVVPSTAKTVEIVCHHDDAGVTKFIGARANGSTVDPRLQTGPTEFTAIVAVDTSGLIEVWRGNAGAGGVANDYTCMRYTE